MKKRYLSFVLAALMLGLLLGPMTLSSFGEEIVSFENKNVKNADGIKVLINGSPLDFDSPIKISEGRTLVPVRKIAEAFRYDVDYDEKTKNILLSYNETYVISMYVGDNSVYVTKSEDNTQGSFIMERQAAVYEGRTYVPLRAVAELFGCNVHWDAKTRTIGINRIMGYGGDSALKTKEGVLAAATYYGQTLEGRPNGEGIIRFGFEKASFYRGEFRNGLPNGSGLMIYSTGMTNYSIMGNFKDGKLMEGSVLYDTKFSFVKDGMVTDTYTVKNGNYIKIDNDLRLDPNWFKALQDEVSGFKK